LTEYRRGAETYPKAKARVFFLDMLGKSEGRERRRGKEDKERDESKKEGEICMGRAIVIHIYRAPSSSIYKEKREGKKGG